MAGKRVVVLGGGFGGVAAARTARALLGAEHEVALVDRQRRTYLCGALPQMVVGAWDALGASRSLGLLANRGVRFVQAEVQGIDTDARRVATSAGALAYDYLVVALGATYDWDAVPGAREAYSFYSVETARRLRRKLGALRRGRVVIAVAGVPYKCPPAPFEMAMLLDWALRRRGVRRAVELHLFTPEPAPLPVAGPEAGVRIRGALEERGIHLHTGAAVTEVRRHGRRAVFSDGTALEAAVVVTVPVHRAPPVVREAGLVGPSGWVEVAPRTLETGVPGVYAIGDVTLVPMANGRGLPKAGVFAASEGETVGRAIAAAIEGGAAPPFLGSGACFIAYSGTQAGLVAGEFLAEGQPAVRLEPPTARGMRAKERFLRDWRRFRI